MVEKNRLTDMIMLAGGTATHDVSSHFVDEQGDPLEYSAASSNERVVDADIKSASSSSLFMDYKAAGAATVTVTATQKNDSTKSVSYSFGVRVISLPRRLWPWFKWW